ncbi:uncharacterized protein VTP21DRAFT_8852 [Calcarisporiella thermophila]|uniref:uncharacterized protein n=1 Tax=Calcarisporiella thermophila TaxID=911321 RepID=UPI0037423258
MLLKASFFTYLLALCLTMSNASPAPVEADAESDLAPLLTKDAKDIIPNNYIVVLKEDKEVDFTDQAVRRGVKHVYKINKFRGYAGEFDMETLKKIRKDPAVAFIEPDAKLKINVETQIGAPWGLARISHRAKLTPATQDKYIYEPVGGENVTAYVIDTGIYTQHNEFEGRARFGASFVNEGEGDGHGHGTHVAGTIGSKTYGIAKKVKLVAVKVFNRSGEGTDSSVIAGVNWAANDSKKNPKNKSVANMSLGGPASSSLDKAVNSAVDAGLSVIIAAGNENTNACTRSPARATKGVCVAASDSKDKKASFSNYGKCVHLIAPGVGVLSTWNNGRTNSISGTSMATPHVAGVAAYFLSINPMEPLALREFLQKVATKSAISGFSSDTPNNLVYNNLGAFAISALV